MAETPTKRHPTDKELAAALPALSVEARIEAIIAKYVGGAMSRHYDGQTDGVTAERRIAAELMRKIKPWLGEAQVASQSHAPREVRCRATGNPCGSDTWATGHECSCGPCQAWLKAFRAPMAAPSPPRAQDWQPIETCPKDHRVRQFWIVPKTADESYTDTSGNPITGTFAPYLLRCGYKGWSALSKATHWRDDPDGPTAI